ncbi:hypothetical protein ACI0X9_003267 [Cronobacter turicensis]
MPLFKDFKAVCNEVFNPRVRALKDFIGPTFERLLPESWLKVKMERLLNRLGYMKISQNSPLLYTLVNDIPGISARLEAHRKLMGIIGGCTDLVATNSWVKVNLCSQDDFLRKLYTAVYLAEPELHERYKFTEMPFNSDSIVKNMLPSPEWIEILSESHLEDTTSGAEWQLVSFRLPLDTPRMVAEFIINSLRPNDGFNLSEYCQTTGEGEFMNMGRDLKPGRYTLGMVLHSQKAV